ncbi:MAG: ABC transporter ATP-binding protein [Planctomycetaceae bacterium]|nr:ABC transporter ATP-binding protein [Planctomycetaceae bacterium]
MPSDTIIIEAKNITRRFEMGDAVLDVLKGVDFALKEGEMAAISGSSGAGKSTLLHILGLLDSPTSGQILYKCKDLTALDAERASKVRNKEFGFVFQFFHLLPEFTALENVMLPARLGSGGFSWLGKAGSVEQRAKELLDRVGLGARLVHLPTQLSGGERQRVAIARALMNSPKVLFCDEPTGNLDSQTAQSIFQLLRELNRESGLAVLIVTHDGAVAAQADTRYVMRDGLMLSAVAVQ